MDDLQPQGGFRHREVCQVDLQFQDEFRHRGVKDVAMVALSHRCLDVQGAYWGDLQSLDVRCQFRQDVYLVARQSRFQDAFQVECLVVARCHLIQVVLTDESMESKVWWKELTDELKADSEVCSEWKDVLMVCSTGMMVASMVWKASMDVWRVDLMVVTKGD